MKKSLVCTICEEVEWVQVSSIHLTDRKWWICHTCYAKIDFTQHPLWP